jgi:hypothetical protein
MKTLFKLSPTERFLIWPLCVLDEATYEKGIEVSEKEFESIEIAKDDFHGEWNYTICKHTE